MSDCLNRYLHQFLASLPAEAERPFGFVEPIAFGFTARHATEISKLVLDQIKTPPVQCSGPTKPHEKSALERRLQDKKLNKNRYWIGVASREHVRLGVRGGFAQFSHGKLGPASRLSKGDWVIYYSGKEKHSELKLCQKFTAIGQVVDSEPMQVEQFRGFMPWRRKIKYQKAVEVDIHPLIARLSFIKNKSRWGMAFRSGFLEIGESDFTMVAERMLPGDHRSPR